MKHFLQKIKVKKRKKEDKGKFFAFVEWKYFEFKFQEYLNTENLSQDDISIHGVFEQEDMVKYPYKILQQTVEHEMNMLNTCEQFPQVTKTNIN